jgi:hypothetical protein
MYKYALTIWCDVGRFIDGTLKEVHRWVIWSTDESAPSSEVCRLLNAAPDHHKDTAC